MELEEKIQNQNPHKGKVHKILAHSYLFYFFAFLVGLFFDFLFSFKISKEPTFVFTGIIFIFFGSLLIIWAQKTSRNFKKEEITKKTFSQGPYFFTRTPTHWGLTFLMLGFGIIANAIFIIIFTIISFLIARFIFIKKEEKILVQKYGEPFLEYKKSVKL
ncbi:MAG: methyltransferase [Candidatus Paceibacterota bacterium]